MIVSKKRRALTTSKGQHSRSHQKATLASIGRVDHAVINIVDRSIRRTSPSGERNSLPTTTSDSKSEHKDDDLSATVERGRDDVVVLDKQVGLVLADIKLRDVGDDEKGGETAVDSDEQVTHEPEDDGRVDVAEVFVAGEAVAEVQRDGDDDAEEVGDCDPLVSRADAEHVCGDAPCDGEGVELLDVLPRPDVCSLDGFEDGTLVLDDGDHHDPIH